MLVSILDLVLPLHTYPSPHCSHLCTQRGSVGPFHSSEYITKCPAHVSLCCHLQSASDGFWKSVATRVPKEPPEIRILNPYFIQEAAFTLIGLPFNNGLMGRGVRLLGREEEDQAEEPWKGGR